MSSSSTEVVPALEMMAVLTHYMIGCITMNVAIGFCRDVYWLFLPCKDLPREETHLCLLGYQ